MKITIPVTLKRTQQACVDVKLEIPDPPTRSAVRAAVNAAVDAAINADPWVDDPDNVAADVGWSRLDDIIQPMAWHEPPPEMVRMVRVERGPMEGLCNEWAHNGALLYRARCGLRGATLTSDRRDWPWRAWAGGRDIASLLSDMEPLDGEPPGCMPSPMVEGLPIDRWVTVYGMPSTVHLAADGEIGIVCVAMRRA